jgi:hypothetical protein
MGERLVPPEGIVPIPPGLRTRTALMEALAIDELREAYPDHEFFVVVWKTLPANPFAVVFRVAKARIAERGWPIQIDPEKRWCVVVPDTIAEMETRR